MVLPETPLPAVAPLADGRNADKPNSLPPPAAEAGV